MSETIRSADGTAIAFERVGSGPSLILVDGGLCYRGMGPSRALAKALAPAFTVIVYDRRGRGESGDTAPYAVEREVEDIAALLDAAGGSACLWGVSSGAMLALAAASRLRGVTKVALYEAPLIVDASRPPIAGQWSPIAAALAADRPGAAVRIFLQMVGAPGFVTAVMRRLPMWSRLTAIAHTLPYDGALVQDYQRGEPLPPDRWATVTVPALVLDGGMSPPWLRHGNRALAGALPNARYQTLPGQAHAVKTKALAPALVEFFGAQGLLPMPTALQWANHPGSGNQIQ